MTQNLQESCVYLLSLEVPYNGCCFGVLPEVLGLSELFPPETKEIWLSDTSFRELPNQGVRLYAQYLVGTNVLRAIHRDSR